MIYTSLLKGKGIAKCAAMVAVAAASVVFTSCLKNDNNTVIPAQDVAAISIINASPNSRTINVAIDDKKLNSSGISYLSGFSYLRAFSGDRKFTVTENSTANTTLINKTLKLNKDTYYSLYIAGVGATPSDSLSYVLTVDSLRAPATNKVRIRFVHLSPGTSSVDVGVAGQTPIFANVPYKVATNFIEIAPINNVAMVIKDHNTGAEIGRLENTSLQSGNNYTVFAKGTASATVNDLKPGLKIINHNQL
ncbi:DUF4397 domain-containing protein [Mucilaginibacter pallidiroseus]|uniref:DUF4397 domain-containing protein n=1 Tax=Mucilaginibacter pallidiroseus TaxID=2599295 RepID=A0A563UCD3_9SPHI|nr:DUF4397 domain-containing protein [Mucilaginibacter pallidiroseus]TWR28943.1 DUF4397 domain-containing protein [Mucilaginibacter pallidiroseus]